jgi:hypothetical protein
MVPGVPIRFVFTSEQIGTRRHVRFRVRMNPTVRTRKQRGCVMQHRRRFKQNITLKDRLTAWADEVRERAKKLPPGPERNALLKKASQAEAASHLDDWANSPGLQPPK